MNTLGRTHIKRAYEENNLFNKINKLILKENYPANYEQYCKIFMARENLDKNCWYDQKEFKSILKNSGFKKIVIKKPFNATSFNLITWIQYLKISKGKKSDSKFSIAKYLIFSIIDKVFVKEDNSNIILIGEK